MKVSWTSCCTVRKASLGVFISAMLYKVFLAKVVCSAVQGDKVLAQLALMFPLLESA